MELSSIVIPKASTWIEYPGFEGLEFEVVHLSRDELMKIRKKAVNNKLNRSTRKMEEELDSDLFQKLWVGAVLSNWRGLKYKYLPKFFPADLNGIDPEEELVYSADNAEVFIKNASGFDDWISSILEDVENFTQANSS